MENTEIVYDIDFFIKFYEEIPENQWCTNQQQNEKGQRCAVGHLMPLDEKVRGSFYQYGHYTLMGRSLFLILDKSKLGRNIAFANNGSLTEYQQSTPKQRTLAFLRDVKESLLQDIPSNRKVFPVG